MKRLKTPKAVTTAVLTLITIFFWAGFEIYRSLTIKPTPTVTEAIINPVDPHLDINTLSTLNQRLFLNDSEIGNTELIVIASPSPTEIPVETPTASQSATPIASESATPAGTP